MNARVEVLRSNRRALVVTDVLHEAEVFGGAVPAVAVERLAARLGVPRSWVLTTVGIPSSTYYARRARGVALAPGHGRVLVDLMGVIAAADRLLRDVDVAWHWLRTPREIFENRTPLEMVRAGEARRVLALLEGLEHGVFM